MSNTNFVEEMRWRGMLQDIMPGTEEKLNAGICSGYIGFDPTADSMHVGHLMQVMTLIHFQRAGHKPYALVGGATGMVGDPSGKSAERNLLDEETLNNNVKGLHNQLEKFLDFNSGANSAVMVNNYDWFKEFSFLNFIRDVGKHITVNYMMAKDSVKKRLDGESGMSFTEFTYQLVQGYDFYYLWKHHGISIQMGGSDQWGNIVTGTELIRRKDGGEAFALTTQLIKKSDGTKFGKTESGAVWLDPKKTSPYKFYQFWLNASDEDVKSWIRIFTLKTKAEIEALEAEHNAAPHLRVLQKALATEITIRVHGETELNKAIEASTILFGASTFKMLEDLDEQLFLDIFDGVPRSVISKKDLEESATLVDILADKTNIFPSRGEARKMILGNGVSINKLKINNPETIMESSLYLIKEKYILVQKGKKNYYLIIVE